MIISVQAITKLLVTVLWISPRLISDLSGIRPIYPA